MVILCLLSYAGGMLTILSPCILPVLPFVFAKSDQPFRKSGLPLLGGMAFSFTLVSVLAVVGGAWVAEANDWGRWLSLVLMFFFGVSLVYPQILEWLLTPLSRLGGLVIQRESGAIAGSQEGALARVFSSFILGIATGFLWAPCAGPILGLILTTAVSQGSAAEAALFLSAYALGAASSLGLAWLAGQRLLGTLVNWGTLRKFLGIEKWVRKGLGVTVLVGVFAIGSGWDRGVLTALSQGSMDSIEKRLLEVTQLGQEPREGSLDAENRLGSKLAGSEGWINSSGPSESDLKGKVVLIDFWTYSCINCIRTLPYLRSWDQRYRSKGLVVIGIHTPEFPFERIRANVEKAVRDFKIEYPVSLDNSYSIWRAFGNNYWPAHYFFDRKGILRHHHFGEGSYDVSERMIQQLLGEGSIGNPKDGVGSTEPGEVKPGMGASGAEAAGQAIDVKSPETYLGYFRGDRLKVKNPFQPDVETKYVPVTDLNLNEWSLKGSWKVGGQEATLVRAPGRIAYRFHARDLHLVFGPAQNAVGKAIRFRVYLDGRPPVSEERGGDVDAEGGGVATESRLFQLVRQVGRGAIRDRIFEIEFLDPGVQVFAFTFG